MQTRRLYYEDCHLAEFDAHVLDCQPRENRWAVILDATAFYPEGGGQSCDTGLLENVRVLETREEGEQVVHICDGPLTVGASVTGKIDYAPRFLRMQGHTGEHMLSGVLHRLFGCHNVGFHMGTSIITVDFDTMLSVADVERAEAQVNALIWQNLPVKTWIPSPEELPGVTYRTKRTLPWPVRIVEIPGVDACACCGVHVAHTGEVGMIKVLSCVKFHQGVRLELVCGSAAMDHFTAVLQEARRVSQAFSAPVLEIGNAAQRMNDLLAAEKFRATGLEKQVFQGIANNYVNHINVLHFQPDLTPAGVRELAEKISGCCSGFAAVFSGEDGAYSYCLAYLGGDLRQLGKTMTTRLNGRGGGKPEFQQGNLKATKAQIEAFFAEME